MTILRDGLHVLLQNKLPLKFIVLEIKNYYFWQYWQLTCKKNTKSTHFKLILPNKSIVSFRLKASHRRCSIKKSALKNFAKLTGKHLCLRLSFNKVAGLRSATLFKKETPTLTFSCEFCEIFNNTFLTEHLRASAPNDHFCQ